MAKINRFVGNVGAFALNSQTLERTVYGDVLVSNNLNDNVNAEYLQGFGTYGPDDVSKIEEFNGFGYTIGQFTSYLYQNGPSSWDDEQEYNINSFVNFEGALYKSNFDGNIGNPIFGSQVLIDPSYSFGTSFLSDDAVGQGDVPYYEISFIDSNGRSFSSSGNDNLLIINDGTTGSDTVLTISSKVGSVYSDGFSYFVVGTTDGYAIKYDYNTFAIISQEYVRPEFPSPTFGNVRHISYDSSISKFVLGVVDGQFFDDTDIYTTTDFLTFDFENKISHENSVIAIQKTSSGFLISNSDASFVTNAGASVHFVSSLISASTISLNDSNVVLKYGVDGQDKIIRINNMQSESTGLGLAYVDGDFFRTTDGGQSFIEIIGSNFGMSSMNYIKGNVFAGTITNRFIYTIDAGDTWIELGVLPSFDINTTRSLSYPLDSGSVIVYFKDSVGTSALDRDLVVAANLPAGDYWSPLFEYATQQEAESGVIEDKAISAKEIKNLTSGFLDKLFPVGKVWKSTSYLNPSIVLGFGTWVRDYQGRVLRGANDTQGIESGGSKFHSHGDDSPSGIPIQEHILTIDQVVSHDHEYRNRYFIENNAVLTNADNKELTPTNYNTGIGSNESDQNNDTFLYIDTQTDTPSYTQAGHFHFLEGRTTDGSSVEPYYVVYMFRRIA